MSRTWAALLFLAVPFSAGCSFRSAVQIEDDYQRLSPSAVRLSCDSAGEESCGLSAVDALTRYFEAPLTSSSRQDLRRKVEEFGHATVNDVRRALEDSGYRVAVFSGELDESLAGVYRHIELGRPVMVLTSADREPAIFRLLVGHDRDPDRVLLFSPPHGFHAWPTKAFVDQWNRKDRLALLALPEGAPGSMEEERQ